MKNNRALFIALAVLIVLAVGGYLAFHTSSSGNSTAPQQSNTPVNNAVLITKTDPSIGQYFSDPNGRPLYFYHGDSAGVSNCTGGCLASWPAYVVSGNSTNLPSSVATIKRADNGQMQYTYNGLPLYYFTGDSQGKVTGNGVDNFYVARPPVQATSPSSSGSASAGSSSPATTPPATSSTNSSPYRAY